ncbi:HemK Methylase of polypeptide chain release factors [Methylophilaceae bacterium]
MLLSVNQTIQQSEARLITHLKINGDEAKFESQLLLQHVLNVNRAWLIAHALDSVQEDVYKKFEALLIRRLNGEPIAYILGSREFFGLPIKVSTDTLIPRPDTETLVEIALDKMSAKLSLDTLDLGTGSGAIALAIAKHRQNAQITAVDACQEALAVAIENAQLLNIKNVHFELSNWFSAIRNQKFDVIVSNPPYIEANDAHLKQGDLRFEPLSALASGADGLQDIRTIISQAPQHLNPQGWLLLEHGYNQAEQVAALLKQAGFSQISHAQDLAGINRVTMGKFSKS